MILQCTLLIFLQYLHQAKAKKKNTDLCINCQHKNDAQGCVKLTDTPDGRNSIMQTSDMLQDGLLISLSNYQLLKIKYHAKTCYGRY